MNNSGALGVIVIMYEQTARDDSILYSLVDDTSDLYNASVAE